MLNVRLQLADKLAQGSYFKDILKWSVLLDQTKFI